MAGGEPRFQVSAMPNGYHGTDDGWMRLEAPLREVDSILEAFASSHGLTLTRNHHGDPERSLGHEGELTRLFQIFVGDEEAPTYKIWLCASQDRGEERFWKQRFLTEAATPAELKASIGDWLSRGWEELFRWSAHDLEHATRLAEK